jgi:hypothetical protein
MTRDMRSPARLLSALALLAAVALVPAVAASAAERPAPKAKASVAKWAKQHHLKGSWRARDTDRDGLTNLREYKLTTDPRKADSDRDGLDDGDEVKVGDNPRKADTDGDKTKDGAEHAGVVTAYDGGALTLRQFKGANLTATLDDAVECSTVEDPSDGGADDADDPGADDSTDDGYWPGEDTTSSDDDPAADDGASAATVDDDPTEVDLGADDATTDDATTACEDAGVEKGALVRSATVERRGGKLYVTALELV